MCLERPRSPVLHSTLNIGRYFQYISLLQQHMCLYFIPKSNLYAEILDSDRNFFFKNGRKTSRSLNFSPKHPINRAERASFGCSTNISSTEAFGPFIIDVVSCCRILICRFWVRVPVRRRRAPPWTSMAGSGAPSGQPPVY